MTAPCAVHAVMWSPAPRTSPRRRLLFVWAAATLAVLFSAAYSSPRLGRVGSLSTGAAFVGARAPLIAAPGALSSRGQRSALYAEPEEEMTSVFDAPTREFFRQKFDHKFYRVYSGNWTWSYKNEKTGEVSTGNWERAWNMPEDEFKKREKSLRQRWRAKKRKLRLKHGKGQRWPNRKLIHLAKLQGSPFTRERYGDKYVGKAAWHFHPNEIPFREQQIRAHELKRRLELEAAETRFARLKELGVWPGEPSWRKPWEPQVDMAKLGQWKKDLEKEELEVEEVAAEEGE